MAQINNMEELTIMSTTKIKIAILDDAPVVVRGLNAILGESDQFQVVGGPLNVFTLDEELSKANADLLLMEADVSGTNAKEVLFHLKQKFPKIKLVIFSEMMGVEYVKMIMRLGAAGFILKKASAPLLLEGLRAVYNGDFYIDETVKDAILKKALHRKPLTGQQKLTKREKEILQLLASNYNSQEVAQKLFLSKKTIENHRSNMLLKFKVKNAASLVMKAIELGLLE